MDCIENVAYDFCKVIQKEIVPDNLQDTTPLSVFCKKVADYFGSKIVENCLRNLN